MVNKNLNFINFAENYLKINTSNEDFLINTQKFKLLGSEELENELLAGCKLYSLIENPHFARHEFQEIAIYFAFRETFQKIRQPLLDELALAHNIPSNKENVAVFKVDFLKSFYSFKITNIYNTFGVGTCLELHIPISLIHGIYVKNLCDLFDVDDDKSGHLKIEQYLENCNRNLDTWYSKSSFYRMIELLPFGKLCGSHDLISKNPDQLIVSINTLLCESTDTAKCFHSYVSSLEVTKQ